MMTLVSETMPATVWPATPSTSPVCRKRMIERACRPGEALERLTGDDRARNGIEREIVTMLRLSPVAAVERELHARRVAGWQRQSQLFPAGNLSGRASRELIQRQGPVRFDGCRQLRGGLRRRPAAATARFYLDRKHPL